MTILLYTKSYFELGVFTRVFIQGGHSVVFVPTAEKAEEFIDSIPIDVVLTDERNFSWVKKIIMQIPSLNIALFSEMTEEQFHEMTEGYGILMKLSSLPEKSDALHLLKKVKQLQSLMTV